MRRIKKVAVLGAGLMGTGIAAHMANIGCDVILLDIVPPNLSDEEKQHPAKRNAFADGSLKKALKAKPAPFYDKASASRIKTGNFDDHMDQIADCDWVVEVIIERLDIKKSLFEKVEKHRTPGTLISSNTSSIPIHLMTEGRSEDFKQHFCGTHFFNPVRYMRLLEIIPTPDTDPAITDFFMHYGDVYLGKQTVLCKDTPAFIANRIGFHTGRKLVELTDKYQMSIEEVDKLTGPAISRPKTGTFRLQDLVGMDTNANVVKFVVENCPEDEYVQTIKDQEEPKYMKFLMENGFIGDKAGQGFYKKAKDESGKKMILALNLETLEYEPSKKVELPSLKVAKSHSDIGKRLQALFASDDKGGQFLKDYFLSMFAYVSNRLPEISEDVYSMDDAMRSGYAWDFGPFEYWDKFGVRAGVEMAEANGEKIADWVKEMLAAGVENFYKSEGGKKMYYDVPSKSFQPVKSTLDFIILDTFREQAPVHKTDECVVHDIGDGVLNLEFTSKSNAIGAGIIMGINETIKIAEEGDWQGIVIGNNSPNFSVGANLVLMSMQAMNNQFDQLEMGIKAFQDMTMNIRYSKIPVVCATQGYVFGGGCEVAMHSNAVAASAESYIGLVEVGVGLLPGAGGTKEFAVRASDAFFEGDVMIPTILKQMQTIATASVGTSADHAFKLGYLQEDKDFVVLNKDRAIGEAKKKVLELAEDYTPGSPREDVTVLGRTGLGALYTAINEFKLGNYMSDHDVLISKKIAYVLCGGDLTGVQKVSEQYLLDIEREAFISLVGEAKTLERIKHMLMTNKPLRN